MRKSVWMTKPKKESLNFSWTLKFLFYPLRAIWNSTWIWFNRHFIRNTASQERKLWMKSSQGSMSFKRKNLRKHNSKGFKFKKWSNMQTKSKANWNRKSFFIRKTYNKEKWMILLALFGLNLKIKYVHLVKIKTEEFAKTVGKSQKTKQFTRPLNPRINSEREFQFQSKFLACKQTNLTFS